MTASTRLKIPNPRFYRRDHLTNQSTTSPRLHPALLAHPPPGSVQLMQLQDRQGDEHSQRPEAQARQQQLEDPRLAHDPLCGRTGESRRGNAERNGPQADRRLVLVSDVSVDAPVCRRPPPAATSLAPTTPPSGTRLRHRSSLEPPDVSGRRNRCRAWPMATRLPGLPTATRGYARQGRQAGHSRGRERREGSHTGQDRPAHVWFHVSTSSLALISPPPSAWTRMHEGIDDATTPAELRTGDRPHLTNLAGSGGFWRKRHPILERVSSESAILAASGRLAARPYKKFSGAHPSGSTPPTNDAVAPPHRKAIPDAPHHPRKITAR